MMEYPFKDLLPLDEVLEREGYYKDWTHLDPKVFYSLTQISEYIKTKGYGVDVRLLIAQLAEHFSLKTSQINEIERFFKDVMLELSEDKDYYSLPEIAGARRGYQTLVESLNNLSFNMFNTNLGKVTPNMVSDELLAQIAGDAAVNAVPADGSLTTPKYALKSITPEVTNFINVPDDGVVMDINTPTEAGHLDFTTGEFIPSVMTTTVFVDLKPNVAYRLIYNATMGDGTEQVQPRAVMIYDKDGNFVERLAHQNLFVNIIYDNPMKIRVNYYLGTDGGVIHEFSLFEKDYVPEYDKPTLDSSIAVLATSITGLEGIDSYDQSLNTSDDVSFASVSTSGTLPTGTLANPPIGLTNGDVWADTTDSQTHPILRVML